MYSIGTEYIYMIKISLIFPLCFRKPIWSLDLSGNLVAQKVKSSFILIENEMEVFMIYHCTNVTLYLVNRFGRSNPSSEV